MEKDNKQKTPVTKLFINLGAMGLLVTFVTFLENTRRYQMVGTIQRLRFDYEDIVDNLS